MELPKILKSLCTPAQVYLVISGITFITLLFQNLRDPKAYQVGIYKIPTKNHNLMFFLMKALYIMAWTWLLNHLCKRGWKGVSWFLLLLPFIGFFVLIGMAVVVGSQNIKAKKAGLNQKKQ